MSTCHLNVAFMELWTQSLTAKDELLLVKVGESCAK